MIMKKAVSVLLVFCLLTGMFAFTSCGFNGELREFSKAVKNTSKLSGYYATIDYKIYGTENGEKVSIPVECLIRSENKLSGGNKTFIDSNIYIGGDSVRTEAVLEDGFAYLRSGEHSAKVEYDDAVECGILGATEMWNLLGKFDADRITEYEILESSPVKTLEFNVAPESESEFYGDFVNELLVVTERDVLGLTAGDFKTKIHINEEGYVVSFSVNFTLQNASESDSDDGEGVYKVYSDLKLIDPGSEISAEIPEDTSLYTEYQQSEAGKWLKNDVRKFYRAIIKTNSLESFQVQADYDIQMEVEGEKISIPMVSTVKVENSSVKKCRAYQETSVTVEDVVVKSQMFVTDGYAYFKEPDATYKIKYLDALDYDLISGFDIVSEDDLEFDAIVDYQITEKTDGEKLSVNVSNEVAAELFGEIISAVIDASVGTVGLKQISIEDFSIEMDIDKIGYVQNFSVFFGMSVVFDQNGVNLPMNLSASMSANWIEPGKSVTVDDPADMNGYRYYKLISPSAYLW